VYDPAGTLTGGSRPASGNLLLELQKLNDAKSELKGRKDALKVSLSLFSTHGLTLTIPLPAIAN